MEKEPKNEMDTKKEYLHSYMSAVKAAKRIEEEIERLRLDKMLPSLIMDDMPHAHDQKDLSDYCWFDLRNYFYVHSGMEFFKNCFCSCGTLCDV